MEKNQSFNESDESEVFNARINEDEMIISIEEYKSMKKSLEYYKCQENEQSNFRQIIIKENSELKLQLEKLEKENIIIKRGIINFIKGLGG